MTEKIGPSRDQQKYEYDQSNYRSSFRSPVTDNRRDESPYNNRQSYQHYQFDSQGSPESHCNQSSRREIEHLIRGQADL
jgi:hypothetical protein